ncbi:MAG: DUF58 domain-containing protein [Candidatus Marinimicrobia bacterium]|jgi:uncharacterized protein (DUF58 family)|nr:DUF58 domain-containing protein [Candidatus Neomarinimicrobiota bacterium]MBT3617636.1 DUF58 domain-containing protein [Candidatus Neomarinimicrobiota bacterium]MBT3829090.1 DUF58 domain-containing protein [Candidatus Neomarinimicrobiota bacterium]MBT3997728.1 DUF58 domain-containing protein [Candidatus Neomarinimicrobiota bacterium]MBT4281385.1 DUF58 domain-containing protein [Candidatus Neomarinimicrobiota bacterium]
MVARLNSMGLRARLVVEGYLIGQHKSPFHGFSVEFADHMAYNPGDNIRHVDWKLYGKTDRYYIKRFEEETNLRSFILMDTSKSMAFSSGTVSKLDYSGYLAAALSYLMVRQRDGVGLVLFDEEIQSLISPKSTQSQLNAILGKLEHAKPGKQTQLGNVLHEMADRISKRGLVIVISDLFDNFDSVISGLKHFRHNNQEVIVFHILDRQEEQFQFNTRSKFLDLETGETITTEPWQIRTAYKELIKDVQNKYRKECQNRKIDYVPLFTDQSLDLALNEYLRKRQRVG